NPLNEFKLNNYTTDFKFKNAIIQNVIHFNFTGNPSYLYGDNKEILINEFIDKDIFIFNCRFKNSVTISIKNNATKIKFFNCVFEKKLIIHNSSYEKDNAEIILHNCQIYDLSIIGNYENLFSIHHSVINFFEIDSTYFQHLVQFIDIIILNEMKIENSYFKKTTIFDNCKFNKFPIFKYNNFEAFTYFRNSEFQEGLMLDYCSFEKDINFYGIKGLDTNISKQNTSQETYRIIKYNFEKLGNKIEANKYHALELDQRKRELEKYKWENLSEYLVFKIHDLSSKHSTSYYRAGLGIVLVGFFTMFLVHFGIVKDLFFHPSNFRFEYLAKIWSELWQYINITNLDKLKDKPFILFFNKVSLGYLYYQFVTSVRKDTRK
ncbi:MAG: hypothetical protein RBT59_11895, partial [Arcobacteraceae bacterium]|nr:hypothetical protein [Arcobacteraceae bacterium]